jgi:hypothetical protein
MKQPCDPFCCQFGKEGIDQVLQLIPSAYRHAREIDALDVPNAMIVSIIVDLHMAIDPDSAEARVISAQWAAFDKILAWLNTHDEKMIAKDDVYDYIMSLRPDGI